MKSVPQKHSGDPGTDCELAQPISGDAATMGMKNQDLGAFQIIQGLLQRYNPKGVEITPDLELTEELQLDSVAVMDLIMEVEDEFELDIPINLIAEVESVQDLVNMVEARLKTGEHGYTR